MIYILIALGVVVVSVIVLSSSPEGIMLLSTLGLVGLYVLDTTYKGVLLVPIFGSIVGFLAGRGCGFLLVAIPPGGLLIWILWTG